MAILRGLANTNPGASAPPTVISPDLGVYGGGDAGNPQQPDKSEIARLIRELSGQGNDQLLTELIRQGMTKGLEKGSGATEGQLQFAGPVQGYSGPTRASDMPFKDAVGLVSPEKATAMGREQSVRNSSPDLTKAIDLLGIMPRGTDDDVQAGILNKAMPGLVPPTERLGHKVTLQERAVAELAHRKGGGKPKDLAGLGDEELKVLSGVEAKPKDDKGATPKTPNSNTDKFLTATYKAAYESTPGPPTVKRSAALAAAQRAAQERGFDANLDEGFFSDSVQAVQRSGAPTAAPTTAAPKRVGTQKGTGKPVFQRPDGSYYVE